MIVWLKVLTKPFGFPWFRGFCVGLVMNMEKALHQISIEKPDHDMLHYLWFEDVSKSDLIHLCFCQLPFGKKPSPAILKC